MNNRVNNTTQLNPDATGGTDALGEPDQGGHLHNKTPHHEICVDCDQPQTNYGWCKPCESTYLKERFSNWSSGNEKLDKVLQDIQSGPNSSTDYLEWIPFDDLDSIELVHKGAFSGIYSATWLEGPRWDWDEFTQQWTRTGPIKVALKRFDDAQTLSSEFLENIKIHHRCIQSGSMADTFGITRDKTGCYMLVMRYYENGDLHRYLEQTMGDISWRDKVDMLWGIAAGLEFIHGMNLYHGNLHGGNLLIEDETVSTDAKISDVGICGPANKPISELYGVLPYVAPEVLFGGPLSKEADIYSFAILMWTISTGQRPFADQAHDGNLALEIYNGVRPSIAEETPQLYADLMCACWNEDPSKRPTAGQINETLTQWITDICDNPLANPVRDQFSRAEERRWTIIQSEKLPLLQIHPNAVYTSRFLNFPKLRGQHYDMCRMEE